MQVEQTRKASTEPQAAVHVHVAGAYVSCMHRIEPAAMTETARTPPRWSTPSPKHVGLER